MEEMLVSWLKWSLGAVPTGKVGVNVLPALLVFLAGYLYGPGPLALCDIQYVRSVSSVSFVFITLRGCSFTHLFPLAR